MTQIFLILMAWLVPMPTWLSIVMTVCMSLSLTTKFAIALTKAYKEEND